MTSSLALDTLPQPLSRQDTARRFWAPAMLCVALLGWGYVRTSPGTQFAAPWGYRGWSFQELAYSDILALHADRGGARHTLPYVEDRIEYPVLMGISMWLPSLAAPNRPGYFAITYAWIALSALGVLWLLCAFPGTQPWIFAASPALLVYAPLNWDLIGALPLALGLWAWAKGRERTATAWLAVAACFKVFPILALWLLLITALRRGWRHALTLAGLALGIALAINLPFALAPEPTRGNWAWFFVYSNIRDIEPSLYTLFGQHGHTFVPAANAISSLTVAATAVGMLLLELRTRRLPIQPALVFLFAIFFLVNKVYSPQYWLWVVLALAFAGAPGLLGAIAGAMSLVDFVGSFARLHVQMMRSGPLNGWYDQHLFWPMVALRYSVLFAIAVWAGVRMWDSLRAGAPGSVLHPTLPSQPADARV